MSQVKENDTVKIHYTGKLQDGQVFDSSLERDPIEFTIGGGQIIPGLEKGLIDMKVNDKKTIEIPQAEAYGDVQKELFQEVPKEQLPQEITPEVGMGLVAKNPDGSERQLRVAEVKDDSIVIDANHPLAGKDLIFDVEVVEIK
ncbi:MULTISPECIES: FKBP-type peptidyl-prolyl cis-trans isomerase [Mesonia]|uniref:Peptidyl-prolyl cis-trans isomerase n=1 Tax=Mesonia mobilis TaxID=369791 RepID=A0ABQ3BNJ5_9FLAO|nr:MULTISPECIES: peptidylprolyl isomerase [Mesonia]MBQ0738252.1 peptidylprolyl isomerase [Aquimarina celericrescens]GGZ49948.1 peptidyl-prolyl cis-trans isomerase [Mesonia mobilis]HIB38263.1 peptidylprolyl isomerase [Mesonia sp.]HIO25982.1 peptidylprolyl isomerase [Flavobacteriaceae bacterium]|tara:strand:+ start:167 stop:595 length:429 start_codon:yes stop_codon:yes gene_type:complete